MTLKRFLYELLIFPLQILLTQVGKFYTIAFLFGTLLFVNTAFAEPSIPRTCQLFNDVVSSGSLTTSLQNYQVIREDCGEYVATRSFNYQNQNYKLVVNKATIQTQLIRANCLRCKTEYMDLRHNTAFEVLLLQQTSGPYQLANHGLKSYQNSGIGQVISVDLCPSTRAFDRPVFDKMLNEISPKPIPIALAVTALWMKRYSADLEWLKQQYQTGRFQITWVNHSSTHPYKPGRALSQNFLLSPGVDFEHEVLGNEMTMIQNGLIPSVFFRFPGLISDEAQILKLREYSLVPLGSLAWLAKGEKVDMRSLILIHGNGNEPPGVQQLLNLIAQKQIFPRALEEYSIFAP